MFDDLIDHSYDNESNDRIRFKLVINEIKKLNGVNIKDFYKDNINRLKNNKKIISEISNDIYDIEYFKKLINNG
jgi:hypothetical protein